MYSNSISRILRAVSLLLALAAGAGANAGEGQQDFRLDLTPGRVLEVENLVGQVVLRRTESAGATVRATVVAESEELAGEVQFRVNERGQRTILEVVYPSGQDTLLYRVEDRRYNTSTRYQGRRYKIISSPDDDAVALHVDLEISLPDGARVSRLANHVGAVRLEGVNADIAVDTSSAAVSSSDGKGRLRADTGSGSVTVSGHRGEVVADTGSGGVRLDLIHGNVKADTGSGSVHISGVSGNVDADTGSGSVTLEDIVGDSIVADTGSGSVTGMRLRGNLSADTGSGSVRLTELADCESLKVDTGSGRVQVEGDLSALTRMHIDTGSGSVDIKASKLPSLALTVETNSGSIEIDLPGLQRVRSASHRFEAEIDGGRGVGVIDTGSGSVRISQAN